MSTATIRYNEGLAEFLCTTTFSSLYQKLNNKNIYIKALEQRQMVNKFMEAHNLLETFELTPKMTYGQKIDGYKLIQSLLIYMFTGNFSVFMHMYDMGAS
jgi:hypothetical protein